MMKLYILDGPSKGASFEIKEKPLYLGRSLKNDIQINDRSISARHLKITKKGEQFFIEDLNSTNGTYIDGKILKPGLEVEVNEGHPIAVGSTLMSLDKKYSMGGTLIQRGIKSQKSFSEKRDPVSYKDRPFTNPQNLRLMYKVSNVLTQSFDINEILEKVMEYLFDCLKRIDRGAILLLDNNTNELTEIIARSRKDGKHTQIDYSKTIVNRVIEDEKAVSMADTKTENDLLLSDSIKALRIRSVMCVPLISRSKVRGVIYVDSLEAPHGYRKGDLQLLTGLSNPAAIAIENALLYSNQEKLVESRTISLHKTEKKLRRSEARFRAIFDNMHSGVVVYEAINNGEDFGIVEFNRAAERIEGIEKQEAIGKRAIEVFPGYQDIELFDVLKRVWKTGNSEHVPAFLYKDPRTEGWRDYDVYRLPSGEIVTLFKDLSGEKKIEEKQKELHNRLLDSQKLESVGRLAGGVAHNFRNIMQAILGNVEYLEMVYTEDSDVKEAVQNINKSVDKGVDLVNSLLHFSRLGKEFTPEVLNLGEVISETHNIIKRLFDKRIKIELNIGEKLFVEGSRSLLSQVFMNLFANAKDAMPDGGKIQIEARKRGQTVIAVVSDTGYGMDNETIDRIYEPFFTAKGVGKGTGLGLSTALGIIEEHKGKIIVESRSGEGTRFEITLPLADSDAQKPACSGKHVIIGGGQRVLIVDDEPSSLDALTGLARGLKYDVCPVDKAIEALEQYKKWKPHVVLMDRSMPEMDGIACIKEIIKFDQQAKIIIVSGYEESGPNGIDEPVKKLIKGYLTKPCGLEDLSRTLSEVLKLQDL